MLTTQNKKSKEYNTDRRNRKSWKKNPGSNKSTGKTIFGYKRERVVEMAKQEKTPLNEFIAKMRRKQAQKRETSKANRRTLARLIDNVDMLYRDGTLVHGPTPVLNAKK